jgi:hypothetical protein
MEQINTNKTKVKIEEICEDCKKLIDKGRHTESHKNLTQTAFKEFPSQFGNVDEYYYKCKSCPAIWLHETGSYGQGWQLLNRTV